MLKDLFKKEDKKTASEDPQDLKSAILLSGAALSACAAALLFLGRFIFCVIGLAALLILTVTLISGRKAHQSRKDPAGDRRSRILFDEEEKEDTEELFSFASLEDIKDHSQFGLYAAETRIGSDRFLCDIVLEDADICPLQAKIIRRDMSYFLTDLSSGNSSYIENRKLKPETEYEIKSGQHIGFASREFLFTTGF